MDNENKPIILAIDDMPSILQSINHTLGVLYHVYTLPFPERMQEILKLVTPDLFILDYLMPKLTGFDLVPIIRSYPAHEETPVVFLTSEGAIDHVSVSLPLGVSDFITKPIDELILLKKISLHLEGYMERRLFTW